MTGLNVNDEIFIRKLTEITLENLGDESFGVKELAHHANISHYVLNRRLQAITGKTVSQFIREIRLNKAMEMLRDDQLTAAEVAYKVGFGSPTYFNTCFHEFFGYPPGKVKTGDVKGQKGLFHLLNERMKKQNKSAWMPVYYIFAGIIVLTGIAFLVYFLMFRKSVLSREEITRHGPEISIAVLPFKNLTINLSNQYFIDGVMEEILNKLSGIHDLRVISRTSVEQYRESSLSSVEIGKKLHADYIVEGSGQKYDSTFRLRVQLIDASKDKHIWAESYEQVIRETNDIFKIQNQIARAIAEEVKVSITPEENKLIEKTSTANLSAYDFYQRGTDKLNIYDIGKNSPSLKTAETMYRNALRYDSTFALAYCGLANVYLRKHFYDSYYSDTYLDSTLILAQRALSYDDHLAEGYFSRGAYYMLRGKYDETIREFSKTISLNPNYWEAYYFSAHHIYLWNNYYADYVKAIEYFQKAAGINRGKELPVILDWIGYAYGNFAGIHEKAIYYYKEALNLDGDSIKYLNRLGELEINSANYKESLKILDENYKADPENQETLRFLGYSHMYSGNDEESLGYFKKYVEKLDSLGEFQPGTLLLLGYEYWQNGYKKEAGICFNKQKQQCLEAIEKGRDYSAWGYANLDLAALYAFTGEKEKAFENLRIFSKIDICPLLCINWLKNTPLFNSIRNDPEYLGIIKDLETKYQAEHVRVMKYMQGKEIL